MKGKKKRNCKKKAKKRSSAPKPSPAPQAPAPQTQSAPVGSYKYVCGLGKDPMKMYNEFGCGMNWVPAGE